MQGDQQGQRLRWTKDVHPGLVSGPTAIASFSKHWEGVGSYESRDPMLVQDAMMDLAASLIPPEVTPGMWREDGNRSMTTTGQTGKRQLSHPVLDTYNQDLCLRPRQRRRKQAPHADNLTPDKSSTSPLLESKSLHLPPEKSQQRNKPWQLVSRPRILELIAEDARPPIALFLDPMESDDRDHSSFISLAPRGTTVHLQCPSGQAHDHKDTAIDTVAQASVSLPRTDLDRPPRSLQLSSGYQERPPQDQRSCNHRHQSVFQERELQTPPQLQPHPYLQQQQQPQPLLGREYLDEARSKTASSPPHAISGMLGPGPGPAPTPSLTLPPLSELDKNLGSESEHRLPHHHSPQSSAVAAGQPRSQSSDPHLHQHFTQQQQQQQQRSQQQQPAQAQQQQQQLPPPPQSSSAHHRAGNDTHSHAYMDHHSQHRSQQPQSPSGQKMYQYDQMNRYYSSTGFPADVHMSSAMAGRSDLNAPREGVQSPPRQQQQQQQQHHEYTVSTTAATKGSSASSAHSYDSTALSQGRSDSRTLQSAHHLSHQRHEPSGYQSGGESANNTDAGAKSGGEGGGSGKASKGAGRGSAGTEHGRNSSKRAAQNRAAQRAFRQRKDLYVRSLEHKAKLLELAEAEIAALVARNQELEAELAATLRSAGRIPSTNPPMEDDVAAASSLIRAANASLGATAPPTSAVGTPYHIRERESDQEWDYGRPRDRDLERDREWSHDSRSGPPSATLPSGPSGPYDPYYHSSAPSAGPHSTRPAIARHSSTQHLHHAYNASSPPLSNGSFKHLSLNSNKSSRYESDQDIEGGLSGQHPPRPHRHLHRNPSESSLNLGRTGTFGSFGSYRDEQQPAVPSMPRLHGDFRSDMVTSPPAQSKSPMSATFAQRSPGHHEPHSASSIQHYPGSPLSPTHERMSLYGPRGSGGSVSSPTSAHGEPVTYDLGKKRPSEGTVNWNGGSGDSSSAGSEAYHSHPHYRSGPLSDGGSGQIYRPAIKKQSSWSSLSDRHRHPSVKKQPSWSSISEHRSHQYHATLRETAQYQRELSSRAASSPGTGAAGSHSASASPAMSSSGPLLGFVPKQHGSMTPSASALTAAAEAARSAAAAANAANAGQVSLPPVSSLSLSSSRRDHAMTSAGEETDEYSEPLSPMQHQQQRFQAQPQHQHGYQHQQQQQQHHQSPQPYQHSQFQQQALHHRASASSLSSPAQGERRPSMPETGSIGSSSS